MEHNEMVKSCIALSKALVALFCLVCFSSVLAEGSKKSIVKWVDDKGVTHYGDRLPSNDVTKSNTELNNQGVVVRTREPLKEKKVVEERHQLDAVLLEQQRLDNALLSTYTSEYEIDLARDRNIKLDEVALQGLVQSKKNAGLAREETLKYIKKLNSKNTPIPPDVNRELKLHDQKIAEIETKISKMHALIDSKKAKYASDKQRFAELKPKALSLQDIQKKEAQLVELRAWKATAEKRLEEVERELLYTKRQGRQVDPAITTKLQNVQAEIGRANEEIKLNERIISEMRTGVSGTKPK